MLRRTFLLGAALALTGCSSHRPVSQGALIASYAEGSDDIRRRPSASVFVQSGGLPANSQFELAAALQEKNPKLRFMATNEALTRLSTGDGVLASRDLSYAVFNKQEVKAENLKIVQTVLGR